MSHQIRIHALQQPETLERILRVVRHRGFRVVQMHSMVRDGRLLDMELHLSGERPLNFLTQQLAKLLDVTEVVTLSCQERAAQA